MTSLISGVIYNNITVTTGDRAENGETEQEADYNE